MEYDIEKILYTFEDDYNPSSTVPGPRNMYAGGQLVQPNADGSRPGYSGKTAKKAILNLPDEGEIDLDKLAKKHKVSTSLISQYRNRYKPNLTSVKKVKQPTMLTKEQQKIFRQYKKLHTGTQSDSSIRSKIKNNIINADTITKLQKGIPVTATDKDKTALDADTIKKIKQKIKLKPGQKWNFYNPETNPTGHTYGIKKSDNVNLYDKARTIGKPKRLETSIKKSKEKYEKIKADPKLLAAAQKDRKEKYLANREEILENQRLKYETDKQWRKAKLEWSRIDKIKNPEKYKKRMNEWLAKRGQFPPGNNYKESVWRDMFRSSQKEGQTRFLLVDENGNQLTQDKFPKVDGKVRWDKNANYKNVKFYDTVTKQFVKLDNSIKGKGMVFEKYLDQKSVGGKGAYENAINGYRNKDTIKNITFTDSKGKNIRIGTVMSDKLKQGSNDFIKSGIVVQHPNIDNAFWKNEISTTSSNDKLNYLEQTLKRELRNAGNNTMLRNKALTKFKTKINNLPGGITKVIEGITYGNAPSSESVVAQVGKDFKIDRFKNFPKDSKSIQNAMLEFAGTVTDQCDFSNADGGRIGFNLGTNAKTKCLDIAKKTMDEKLTTGKWKSPKQAKMARNIAETAGKIGKTGIGARIMAELFGPVALASLPVFEVGIAGYDTITSGTPFKEAVNKTLLHYAAGDKTKADPEKLKRADILKMSDGPEKEMLIGLFSNMGDLDRVMNLYNKKYSQTQNKDQYEMVDMMGYGDEGVSAAQAQKQIDAIGNKIAEYNAQGKDYMTLSERVQDPYARGLLESKEGELLAKRDANSLSSRLFGTEDPYYTSPTSSYSGEVLPERIEAMKARGPSYKPGNYGNVDFNPGIAKNKRTYSREEIINFLEQNNLDYTDEGVDKVQLGMNSEYFKDVLKQPGMLGTQYSEGGIASLNVNKK